LLAQHDHRLEELYLTNNSLSSLPPLLGRMAPHLRCLQLDGNCLRTIRRPILDRGTAAVLEYLVTRIPA
jgi:Leucine-rich repeat (LRR) protein